VALPHPDWLPSTPEDSHGYGWVAAARKLPEQQQQQQPPPRAGFNLLKPYRKLKQPLYRASQSDIAQSLQYEMDEIVNAQQQNARVADLVRYAGHYQLHVLI
jgi:hypothetical protein